MIYYTQEIPNFPPKCFKKKTISESGRIENQLTKISIAFLYTSNKHAEKEIIDTLTFTIALKKINV